MLPALIALMRERQGACLKDRLCGAMGVSRVQGTEGATCSYTGFYNPIPLISTSGLLFHPGIQKKWARLRSTKGHQPRQTSPMPSTVKTPELIVQQLKNAKVMCGKGRAGPSAG